MRPNIHDLRSVGDFATVYQWNLEFITFPAAMPSKPTARDMNIRCVTSTLPTRTGESIPINIRGHKVKQPGIYVYDGMITLVFAETIDAKVLDFLRQWGELCWQTHTGIQLPKTAAEAVIRLVLLNRMDQPYFEYILIGAYLENSMPGTLEAEGSDIRRPEAVLSYDLFEYRKLV